MEPFVPTNIPAQEQLASLLQLRGQWPDQIAAIDAEIRDRFRQTHAIVVIDMVGFSRKTQVNGIIPALQEIHLLQDIAIPILEKHGGRVFKVDADNLYVVFADAQLALQATDHLLVHLNAADIHVSIGIGYGEVLVIGDDDLYGHEMNLASKLGEDIAGNDEILLTEAAYNFLVEPPHLFKVFTYEISGVMLTFYQLQRQLR